MAAPRKFSSEGSAGNSSISDFLTMDCDVLTTEDCSGSEDEEESSNADCNMLPEFNYYWKAAIEKPYNFIAWTKLVTYAEHQKNVVACRKAYDAFLARYPLSHIYWKKYADLEQHLGSAENVEKIYDRAVQASPLNVSMWMNYINYLKKNLNMALTACVDKLRGVFKNAVKACGMEFHSDELWKTYIEFEIQQKNLKEVTAIFDRVLTIPTQRPESHYERFKFFVSTFSPMEILNQEEWDWIRSRIQLESDNEQITAEDTDDCVEFLTDSDIAKFRYQILKIREQLHLLNVEEVQKRSNFEQGIKRLYFLTAPINIKQLQNWRRYLEFEIAEGQHERIVLLFERCLMTCALYEDFWVWYAKYMEGHSVEAARSIYERACRIHLPLKYTLHLQWAAFEEKHGCLDSARAILCRLENVIPSLAIVRLRRVGLERRNGNLKEAERLLKEAVEISADKKLAGFYAVKLSRLILKLQKDPSKAKTVLNEAIKKDPDNPVLHMTMLEVEMSEDNAGDDALICMGKALKCKLPEESKKIISQQRLEFLEDFGHSLTSWFDAFTEHQTYLKRKEDDGKKDKDSKKAKTDVVSEDCCPPGLIPPTDGLKSEVPAKFSSKESSGPANPVSTRTAPVSSLNHGTPTAIPCIITPAPNASYHRSPRQPAPPQRSYFPPPRTYGSPQNVPVQSFVGNQFPQPNENVFPEFNPAVCPPLFSRPPLIPDNPGMPLRMPPLFGVAPWFQNFWPHVWNRFFPPQ